jgi:toxin ParE1/3/4
MRYEVFLTEDAARDLQELYDFIADADAPAQAEYVVDRIEAAIDKLAALPGRGSHPKELLALGVRDHRQTFFKPYRIIYRVTGKGVYVYLIADGRRDMQTLLARRLLGG